MSFSETTSFVLYPIYNQLAIHNAPLFILDLFLPILTTASWEEVLRRDIEGMETFADVEDLLLEMKE